MVSSIKCPFFKIMRLPHFEDHCSTNKHVCFHNVEISIRVVEKAGILMSKSLPGSLRAEISSNFLQFTCSVKTDFYSEYLGVLRISGEETA